MGIWRYKKVIFYSLVIGMLLIIFGQNFEFVPRSSLFRPSTTEEDFLNFVRSPQSVNPAPSFLQRFLFRRPPIITQKDMSFEGMGNKLLNTGVDHFLNDEEFRNSELGRTYQDIEKKTKVNVKLKNSPLASVASIEDVEVAANQNSAYFKMKTQSLSTKMNYSVQSQNMDILFHRPESSHQSIGVGYDPKSDTSQVKMQVDW